jgi:hypothetical protein
MKYNFKNANQAFNYFYKRIPKEGIDFDNTKALFDVGFTIKNPLDNIITNKDRNFSIKYAEAEWNWYLSGDNSIDKLGQLYGKIPLIWERMSIDRHVNSNYGYQWERNYQLDYVVAKLKDNRPDWFDEKGQYNSKAKEDFEKYRDNRDFEILLANNNTKVKKIHNNYQDVIKGEKLVLFNSIGLLEIAINDGSAEDLLMLHKGANIRVRFT